MGTFPLQNWVSLSTSFLPTIHNYHGESEIYISEGNMQTRPKRTERVIDNCYTWLMAWNIYEQVIIEKHPQMYPKLVKYRTLIQQCDRRYLWHSIYSYDVQFRAKRGAEKSFALYTTILDATAYGLYVVVIVCNVCDVVVTTILYAIVHFRREPRWRKRRRKNRSRNRKINGPIVMSKEAITSNTAVVSLPDASSRMYNVCQKCRGTRATVPMWM